LYHINQLSGAGNWANENILDSSLRWCRMQRACGRVCIQLNLLLIYRYVQSSLDTSLYYNDPEFASPGFMLAGAGDDLPKPPAPQTTAKQQEKEKGNKLTSEWRRSVDDVLCRILSEFRVVAQCFVLFLRILSEYCPLCSYCFFLLY